ncbi:protein MFI [Chanos chanos]|uniref:Protein MFI n=1 Tax=Chanos chanos TaxID=29144 RepID=A0A6J2UTN2_CHACN|nr:uncharacterized protein C11orf65 homolog [Chanos chanos]
MDNDKVFYSNRPPRRKTASMCDPEDVYYPGSTQCSGKQYHMGTHFSSSCADLRYGLEKGRAPNASLDDDTSLDEIIPLDQSSNVPYDWAARVIQRTWRKHVAKVLFRHLKNIVRFHNQSDPRPLLRHINPREAEILDVATGAYIRFRLGGTSFPPNIYYKIFTRCPIVDLCASSPRDYTSAQQKKPLPRQIYNCHLVTYDDRSGWYCRVENNGWRLLSRKETPLGDPITWLTSHKKLKFHYSKMCRQRDFERKKKIRKIEWMRKMYEVGALHARTEHRETAVLVERSTEGMMNAVEQLGPDHVADWEVDELVEWTNALNFDEYLNEWRDLGTSYSPQACKDTHTVLCRPDPSEFAKLSQEDSQLPADSSTLHLYESSLIKSEQSRVNLSD